MLHDPVSAVQNHHAKGCQPRHAIQSQWIAQRTHYVRQLPLPNVVALGVLGEERGQGLLDPIARKRSIKLEIGIQVLMPE